MTDHGRSAAVAASGLRPSGAEPQDASQAKPLVPNAGVRLADFTDEYRSRVCKIGQGSACCRYLTTGAKGFECAKRTSLRFTIDDRAESMTAKGDNCDGAFEIQPAFALLREHWGHPPGTIVYPCKGYDYGLASDDTRATGKPHSSMTLEPSGDYPSFTIPDEDFAPASGTEAGTGETEGLDPKGDGPTLEEGDAQ